MSEINLRVRARAANDQVLKVYGNVKELGSWNLHDAITLVTDEHTYPEWSTPSPIMVPRSKGIRVLSGRNQDPVQVLPGGQGRQHHPGGTAEAADLQGAVQAGGALCGMERLRRERECAQAVPRLHDARGRYSEDLKLCVTAEQEPFQKKKITAMNPFDASHDSVRIVYDHTLVRRRAPGG